MLFLFALMQGFEGRNSKGNSVALARPGFCRGAKCEAKWASTRRISVKQIPCIGLYLILLFRGTWSRENATRRWRTAIEWVFADRVASGLSEQARAMCKNKSRRIVVADYISIASAQARNLAHSASTPLCERPHLLRPFVCKHTYDGFAALPHFAILLGIACCVSFAVHISPCTLTRIQIDVILGMTIDAWEVWVLLMQYGINGFADV